MRNAAAKSLVFMQAAFLLAIPSRAADNTASLTLKDHRFTPAEIHVKAHLPTVVTLTNQDDATEEFDSTALKVEKVVSGHSTGTFRIRPLAPGIYPFMGEFHEETARGVVIAE